MNMSNGQENAEKCKLKAFEKNNYSSRMLEAYNSLCSLDYLTFSYPPLIFYLILFFQVNLVSISVRECTLTCPACSVS